MTQFTEPHLYNISTYCRSLNRVPNGTVAYQHLNAVWKRITRVAHTRSWMNLAPTEGMAMAGYNNRTFANFTLTVEDERKFQQWLTTEAPQALEELHTMIGQGYKVSVTWVIDSSAFCLSLIGTDDTKPNRNAIMTTWSDDLEEVILLAAYKHLVVCDSGSWPTRDNSRRWG